jgi:hypothetical protein
MSRNSRKATRERDHLDLEACEGLELDKQATLPVMISGGAEGQRRRFSLGGGCTDNQNDG